MAYQRNILDRPGLYLDDRRRKLVAKNEKKKGSAVSKAGWTLHHFVSDQIIQKETQFKVFRQKANCLRFDYE